MNEAGLRAVFLAERPMLLRLLSARVGSSSDAEDLLQDMWLKLEGAASGPVAQPAAYLYRMANNLAFDRQRSAARRAARDSDWLEVQSTADETPDAEQALLARERLAHVEAALAALPERINRAFRMYRFEALPQKVIAQELGVTLSAVEKMLQRAYRQIHDAGRENDADITKPRRLASKENFRGER